MSVADHELLSRAPAGGGPSWETAEVLQALIRSAPLAIGVVGFDGNVRLWNPAAERMFGWTAEEIVGRRLPTVPEEHADVFRALIDRTRRGESVSSVDVVSRTKDGALINNTLSTAPLRGPDGTFQAMMGIAVDVTDRKRTDEELRASNEALEALVNASPLAIVTFDLDGVMTMWNPAAERMFGWTAREALGRFHPIVPEDKREEFRAFREIARRGGTLAGVEVRRVRKDGTPVDIRFFTAPLRDESGAVTSIMSILADVTEQKRTEEALRMSEEQLRQAQKMEAVGRLAGGIAHDFNNLLTAITGHAELIQERVGAGDPLWGEIEEIRRAAERSATLTRQLLAFSRRQVLQLRVIDLNGAVATMERMLRRLIGEDVDLVTVLEADPARIRADAGQIEQVVMNLAVNAREAMPQGGVLTVTTRSVTLGAPEAGRAGGPEPGSYVALSVSDTGCGMTEKVQSHLFEPFFTTKECGTGLGLATVYGIVRQANGHIRCESAPWRGATFEILFPRVDEMPELREPVQAACDGPRGMETVLVVEDEELVRNLVCEVLRRNGYTILEARNGAEALRVAEGHAGPIHLMVTDVVMPRMGGNELAERLAPARPGLKILFMSGYTDDEMLRYGVMAGGKAFIQKPFRTAALAVRVRELLDADPAGDGATG